MAKKLTYKDLEHRIRKLEQIIAGINADGTLENLQDNTKRKNDKAALHESESRLKALSDASFESIFLSEKGICLDQNSTAQKMFGFTLQESVGRNGTEWIAPKDRERVKNNMLSSYEKPYKITALRKDGTTFPAEIQARMINYKGRRVRVTALRDITEREQATVNLLESEEKYKSLTNNLNVGIYRNTVGTKGKFIEANPAIVKMFGFNCREDFLKVGVSDLYKSPYDREKFIEKLLKEGAVKNAELDLQTMDGTSFTGSVSAIVIKDEKGQAKYIDGIIEDITKRKQAESDLIESEKKYRTILEANPDPVVIYDMEGSVVYFNPAFTTIFGWSMEECLGKKLDFFVPEKAWPETKAMIEMVRAGKRLFSIETNRYDKKGKIIPVSISGAIYKDPHGNSIGSIINLRDISKQKRIETQLQHSQKMEAIGTLAGGIAHDFNNILSGIFGYSQLAEMNIESPEKAKKHIAQIVKGAQRASALVQQILTFSRQAEYKKQPLNIFDLLKEALKLLHSTIPSNIEIKENIHSKAMVMADSTQIHQVIMNLCTNAYHAMLESGGVMTIGLTETVFLKQDRLSNPYILPGKYLKLEVSDTGYGIDEKKLKRIFDPYFTTKAIGKGTGLGLAVVDGIVKNHNGFIKVYSKVASGSTFAVFWPVIEQKRSHNVLKAKRTTLSAGTERIMLVDDEPDILNTQRQILETQGYKVAVFMDGLSALQVFLKDPEQFDLIITDMTMPQMSGNEFSAEILKIRQDIPIILCTGYHETFTKNMAHTMGIRKYIQKPVTSQELSDLIRKILDK